MTKWSWEEHFTGEISDFFKSENAASTEQALELQAGKHYWTVMEQPVCCFPNRILQIPGDGFTAGLQYCITF